MNFSIKYNVNPPTKIYCINELEKQFLENLSFKINDVTLVRMADGTLAVNWNDYPVGKIKLQGRKHWMQIIKSIYKSETIEGSIDDFIRNQEKWIEYMKKHLHYK